MDACTLDRFAISRALEGALSLSDFDIVYVPREELTLIQEVAAAIMTVSPALEMAAYIADLDLYTIGKSAPLLGVGTIQVMYPNAKVQHWDCTAGERWTISGLRARHQIRRLEAELLYCAWSRGSTICGEVETYRKEFVQALNIEGVSYMNMQLS